MTINFIKIDKLRTGNKLLDKKIGYLLSAINGDIESILNDNGNVSCKLINQKMNAFLAEINKNDSLLVTKTLEEVRHMFRVIIDINKALYNYGSLSECEFYLSSLPSGTPLSTITINTLLNKCTIFSECESILKKYGPDISFSIVTLNILLNKCRNISECETVIGQYSEGLEFNTISYAIIFKILLHQTSYPKDVIQDLIKDILIKLNQLPDLNKTNINVLCNQISSSMGIYNTFITETIEQLNLTQLFDLKNCGKLYPKGKIEISEKE